MKTSIIFIAATLLLSTFISCGSGPNANHKNLREKIIGTYANDDENEFDLIRDTIEIRPNDKGTFDVIRTTWSSAKVDDPMRPVNKVAGEWNNNSGTKILLGEFQGSDTTVRITDQMSGQLITISFDIDAGMMTYRTAKGKRSGFQKTR